MTATQTLSRPRPRRLASEAREIAELEQRADMVRDLALQLLDIARNAESFDVYTAAVNAARQVLS